ncbi:MAG: hypothetical protein WAR76_20570, partial [Xanthobacteraceae bacterium]
MPLVRSNSGNSCSYAPVNPPDIRTFTARVDIFLTLATRLGRYVLGRYVPSRSTHGIEHQEAGGPYAAACLPHNTCVAIRAPSTND